MADQVVVRETLSITNTNVTRADRVIGSEFNRISLKALAQAERYLDFGPEDARLQITKAFLSSLSKLSALDSRSEMEVHREEFSKLLHSMTEVNESHPVVTPTGVHDANTHDALPSAFTRPTDD